MKFKRNKIKFFYDKTCLLSRIEVSLYQSITKGEVIDWIGLDENNQNQMIAEQVPFNKMETVYAKDNDNNIHKGLDAFIVIWQQMSYFNILAQLIKQKLVYIILNSLYQKESSKRAKKNN